MKLGILGAGQLGRMLALSGIPLGMHFRFLDPAAAPCAAEVGEHVQAAYDDAEALQRFARGLDAITLEFENVPVDSLLALGDDAVRPGAKALACAQDRAAEKQLFEKLGIDLGPWRSIDSLAALNQALADLGTPCVLKTRRLGYDGKGQVVIRDASEAEQAWDSVAHAPCVLESFVDYSREVSIVVVRAADGQLRSYPLCENRHSDGILHSTTPRLDDPQHTVAEAAARRIAEVLGYVGVLTCEFFEVGGRLLINEMAPRVHNSGHWTIEGAQTSQFENHLRAVCGLPLGSTELLTPCCMINLIGKPIDTSALLAIPGLCLHDYAKTPRSGRKLGHVTIVGSSDEAVQDQALCVETLIGA